MPKNIKILFMSIVCLLLLNSFENLSFAQGKILDLGDKPKETDPNKVTNFALSKSSKIYALRLKPQQDVKLALEQFAKENSIKSGFIVTAVGSLQEATLRLADQKDPVSYKEKLEIVSLVGTISPNGVHFHVSLADKTGKTFGGHMSEGCKVYTTVELFICSLDDVIFSREDAPQTGFRELVIKPALNQKISE